MSSAPTSYTEPRAHELRERYLATYGADEIPVPVESFGEPARPPDRENDLGDCSGMLIPSVRLILVNAAEATNGDVPARRRRFTIAHELGHWICHAQQDVGEEQPSFCRSRDLSQDADRDLEREANVFGAELLMPVAAERQAWAEVADAGEVAARFEVSTLAAQWRLHSFGSAEKPF